MEKLPLITLIDSLLLRRFFFTSLSSSSKKLPTFPNPIPNPNPNLFPKKKSILLPKILLFHGGLLRLQNRRNNKLYLPPSNADKAELFRGLEATLGSPFSSEPLLPPPNPLIIVISRTSGVGKDAVIMRLQEVREGMHFVVTATSCAKRPGEVDGNDYYFVTKEEFLSMIKRNELLVYALVYRDFKGIPKQQGGPNMVVGEGDVMTRDSEVMHHGRSFSLSFEKEE